jgi:uncharacterized nucleotidyltransferase DUF6036
MALLTRQEIVRALERLGELAAAEGHTVRLVVVGGAAMVLGYNARQSTKDVDALLLPPPEGGVVRPWVDQVAREFGWQADWLNDAAKGYMIGLSTGVVLLRAPGVEVSRPSVAQLLAMKLCAWRDDVDIADARRLIAELPPGGSAKEVWQQLVPFLIPGRELKAQYAFEDLWESDHGHD